MIGLFVLALAGVAEPAADPKAAFSQTRRAYQDCVREKIVQFEPAGETVAATIDGAFAACAKQRAQHAFAIMELQKGYAGQTDDQKARKRDAAIAVTEDSLRQRMTAILMEVRAVRNKPMP